MYNRATLEIFLLNKHALALFKLFNTTEHTAEWVSLNLNQVNTTRQLNFITSKSNKKKVGLNALADRLFTLNNKIPLAYLNKSLDAFKMNCKNAFLNY